jgi:hypothetical protein
VVVLDDGSHRVFEPPAVVTLEQLGGFRDARADDARAMAA